MANNEFLIDGRSKTYDTLSVLKAKGTVATGSMVGESPLGTDIYFDTGGGRTKGDMVLVVYGVGSSVTAATASKLTFKLQGSKNSSFSTMVDLQIIELGDATLLSGSADLGADKYIVPFSNSFGDTVYRYLQHTLVISGMTTLGTGTQYEVFLSNLHG